MIIYFCQLGTFPNNQSNGFPHGTTFEAEVVHGVAVTIFDIAVQAGTSKSTVSRYLNGGSISPQKAEQIEAAIERSGYSPNVNARRLVKSQSSMVGIVFDDISNYVYGDMMAGFQDAARVHGFNCLFLSRATGSRIEADFLPLVSSSMVDGLIFVSMGRRLPENVQLLEQSGSPIVLVGDACGTDALPVVDVYNSRGTEEEVAYLIERGHRRIAYLQGPSSMPASETRLQGYLHALESAGIAPDQALIRQVSWTIKDAYKQVSEMLKETNFTALIGSNAYSTYGGLLAVTDSGRRVPEDIAVAGFDDDPICAHTRPGITTLKQPFHCIGEKALETLLALIAGEPLAKKTPTLITPELIVRETT